MTSETGVLSTKRERAEARRQAARRRQRLIGSSIGVVLLAFIVVIAAAFVRSGGEAVTGVTDPEAWDLPALEGEGRVTLAQFAGRPTVAAFFAAWCDVCVWELPEFAVLSQTELGRQLNWVGIDMMDHGSGLGLARQSGIDIWPLARDVGGLDGRGLATALGARGSPMTVLYDSDGRVADVIYGGVLSDQLADRIEEAFALSG